MTSPPDPDCWLCPGVEVRRSPIAGRGAFATAPIPAGAVVSRLGGQLVSHRRLRELFAAAAGEPGHPYIDTITVGEDLHLVLPPRRPNGYGNHGCGPNLWWIGSYELAARRAFGAGDYATSTDDPAFRMPCRCGSPLCRGVVTGNDWRLQAPRTRYGGHWVPALLARIRSADV
jgi:hypothetical protein